jgi:hypothetical protein
MPSLVMVGAITEQAASRLDESGDAFHNHEFVRHAKRLELAEWAAVQGVLEDLHNVDLGPMAEN